MRSGRRVSRDRTGTTAEGEEGEEDNYFKELEQFAKPQRVLSARAPPGGPRSIARAIRISRNALNT